MCQVLLYVLYCTYNGGRYYYYPYVVDQRTLRHRGYNLPTVAHTIMAVLGHTDFTAVS